MGHFVERRAHLVDADETVDRRCARKHKADLAQRLRNCFDRPCYADHEEQR